ncbi:asparagine synthase (glutamine-hydrolyzing) [Romboutsia ilealis]|uniref:asparagine synthase (glutamine-hydrolyzing) n=1 Tax=Romboutsia faecis TaxID=2764597 RepID=A0ABR7JR01_9FIRM|nr:asparagine synthase (glutamine-hydrolyzing) [Romboutsia faecis]MBC5997345.1 asparagine synthase (glutamine-hydrolyzing) [Romboutsia faecis]MRN23627.1 asparagine synthase (glutamine-hydrolyzing) [Romboutsia ilealis]
MCGIAGWCNLNDNIKDYTNTVEDMIETLRFRGPNSEGIKAYTHAILGHRRLAIVDPTGGIQPMTKVIGDREYTICYNGELYNTEEVRESLIQKGYKFNSYSDTEVLLIAYIEDGPSCLDYINGIYAFGVWDDYKQELFLARDPLGVKPLFYTFKNRSLVFASEEKALLTHPLVESVVDRQGFLELISLGPARNLGSGIFKDIKEVPPAYSLTLNKKGITLNEYWKLEAKEHEHNIEETKKYVRDLLIEAIEGQLVSDVPVCTFLSGGLDSSIISKVASDAFKRNGKDTLNTFSIDYTDNEKYFKKNLFQPDSDAYWVKVMAEYLGSNHHNVVLDNIELARALKSATIAADLPGMADIDSSLDLFSKEVSKHATIALSGECADEVFGGYPWYTRDYDSIDIFPWATTIVYRKNILNDSLKDIPIEEYVKQACRDSIAKTPKLYGESKEDSIMRELSYLNLKWFMVTLLNRKDRMTMCNSLEGRVPFADKRLVEYAFNMPKNIKLLHGREKGLLREAAKGILPESIVERKKSPYPKTHNPIYTKEVSKILDNILKDSKSPIHQIIDEEFVKNLVQTGGAAFNKPWFDQLMTGPQVIAYLIQVNTWMELYNVDLQI